MLAGPPRWSLDAIGNVIKLKTMMAAGSAYWWTISDFLGATSLAAPEAFQQHMPMSVLYLLMYYTVPNYTSIQTFECFYVLPHKSCPSSDSLSSSIVWTCNYNSSASTGGAPTQSVGTYDLDFEPSPRKLLLKPWSDTKEGRIGALRYASHTEERTAQVYPLDVSQR